jgi:sorting nexin-8
VLPPVDELAAKPPQTPVKDRPQADRSRNLSITGSSSNTPGRLLRSAMDDPEDDPWNTPDVHKNHAHAQAKPNGAEANGHRDFDDMPSPTIAGRSISQYASTADISTADTTAPSENPGSNGRQRHSGGSGLDVGWGGAGGFNDGAQDAVTSPFGGAGVGMPRGTGSNPPPAPIGLPRSTSGRTGSAIEENILVALMPEKEGMFMFQHHNYEVSSQRRGSKVIRRYSDFVWLLDCLQKRYPFRVLPLLPPKRVAVNGNHLSNDNLFIEKRRRGLARFLNALVRHPLLAQEQLVVMFLTVPTVCPPSGHYAKRWKGNI